MQARQDGIRLGWSESTQRNFPQEKIAMHSPPHSNWPAIRRGLILMMVLIGAMSLYTLLLGRPGDFGAGVVGMVFGGAAGLTVVLVEGIGRWIARRQDRP